MWSLPKLNMEYSLDTFLGYFINKITRELKRYLIEFHYMHKKIMKDEK